LTATGAAGGALIFDVPRRRCREYRWKDATQ
jgi:hypothetical protein